MCGFMCMWINVSRSDWTQFKRSLNERTNERVRCQQFCMWTMVDHNRYCIVSIFVIQKPWRLGKVHLCALRFSVDGFVLFFFLSLNPYRSTNHTKTTYVCASFLTNLLANFMPRMNCAPNTCGHNSTAPELYSTFVWLKYTDKWRAKRMVSTTKTTCI